MLFWVVDAGGTKTHSVLADDKGRVYAQKKAGTCNLSMLGAEGCREVLHSVMQDTCAAGGITPAELTHAFLALGGLDTQVDRDKLEGVATTLFAGTGTVWKVENDVLAALYSGTLGEPGVVLLAGTGSMVMAQDAEGRIMRSGGWGYLVTNDPGSAFYIGQCLLRHILWQYDAGVDPAEDNLTAAALKMKVDMTLHSPTDLVDWIEAGESPPTRIAQMAKVVSAAAEAGDPIAINIIKEGAAALVELLHLLWPRLTFRSLPVPIVMAGGMYHSELFLRAVKEQLAAGEGRERWRPVIPAIAPIGGSFVGALLLAGLRPSREVMERFAAGLAE